MNPSQGPFWTNSKVSSEASPKNTLTKLEIASRISEDLGFSLRSSKILVDDCFKIIKDALLNGEKVKIVRFGSFLPLLKNPRKGINPNTKEELTIPGRRTVVFRPSPLLKKGVNAQKRPQILSNRSGK